MQSGIDGNCDALGKSEEFSDRLPLGIWLGDTLGAPLSLRDGSCDALGETEGTADGLPVGV